MLKMLTILTNILVGNLITLPKVIEPNFVRGFVNSLVDCMRQPAYSDIRSKLNELDAAIPITSPSDSIVRNALSYGCSLLKELAFKFVSYTQDEVADTMLKHLLMDEYSTIIRNHVTCSYLYEKIITQPS